ncbi:MAG: HAMP domain-containing protein [Fuerstiella sp.]|nr:HAMP domain-containing protein [Fuerstiella sp.]MCP4856381.1 HAMP domain-containing protein [Fuerstiella sp.]
MTQLFLRFYAGVLVILVAAAAVQNFETQQQNRQHNLLVVEQALGGGVRLARGAFNAFPDVSQDEMLQFLKSRFSYPVSIIPQNDIPEYVAGRFEAGDDVVFHATTRGGMLKTMLESGSDVLSFGPLPEFAGPDQLDVAIGIAVILAIAAVAIAFLLRPVARQFRLIESTAMRVASGDLGARVDESRTPSTRPMARAFNHVAARTETLLRTQRELMQAVSHEFRTPLSRIQFATDLIRTAKNEEDREVRLQAVESAAEDLDKLVGELLRYVKVETGVPELKLEDIPLLPLVNELIKKNAPVCPQVAFRVGDSLSSGAVVARADAMMLERAIGNLIANAARFADKEVVIDATTDTNQAVITVDDDGCGIPESARERIFEPFVRLRQKGSGTGLGLALVRRILGHHGGAVQADSNEVGGCRMVTRWPHQRSNSILHQAADSEPTPS